MWDNFWAAINLPLSTELHSSSLGWYRFQNSPMVRDNDLKFGMVIVLGKLEDLVTCFLPGSVHKRRQSIKFFLKIFYYAFLVDWRHLWTLPGGSKSRSPPVFQALSPHRISSQYLKPLESSGSDTIKRRRVRKACRSWSWEMV
jgi:hypothetical protein